MVLWGIAAIFIGEAVFHVETQNAVATLGIASLYLSQGMQDFIKNLVAGTQIVLGGVLKVGDHIVVGENRGEVMDVNWRQTIIRDRSGSPRAISRTDYLAGGRADDMKVQVVSDLAPLDLPS